MAVILETSIGQLTVDLYTDERPRCCLNFLKLCKIKYYNFCLFHSVQHNLVAQSGDPEGTGKGGDSVFRLLYGDQARYFEQELKPRIKHSKLGQLSMVNNGANMHGSQFFITLAPNIDYLDGKHTVFGEVAEGFDVLQKLNEVYVDKDNRPYKDIRIYHTVVLDDPYDDPPGLDNHIPDHSPQLTREQLDTVRIGADEEIDDTKGLKPEEINKRIQEREAKAHAQILEMVGDIPDADVKPEDNVLFVCKLNPVTTEEDLEIIFSRFGKILSCEVIKDQKTGNSLQYAFIEFETATACENAYFKMDNVLIDERRIHVDFSQSVAKVRWKGKGKGVEQVASEKDDSQPRYRIKDIDTRQDARYDYVFDEDDAKTSSSKHKSSKKHKKHRSRSPSGDNHRQKHGNSTSPAGDEEKREKHKHKDDKHHHHHLQLADNSKKRRHDRSHSRSPHRSKDSRHHGKVTTERHHKDDHHRY